MTLKLTQQDPRRRLRAGPGDLHRPAGGLGRLRRLLRDRARRGARCSSGESGSGKTTVGLSLLGHARRGLEIAGGSVLLGDDDILTMDEARAAAPARLAGLLRPAGPGLRRSTPRCGSGCSCARCSRPTARDHEATTDERIAELMREVALPDDPRLPAPLPARALGRPAAAGRARDGVRQPAAPDRARRADHRPRRHDAGHRARRPSASSPRRTSVAALYVSHDLAVVAALARRVAVMYAGRIVELGTAEELFDSSAHPYTRRLVGAIPRLKGPPASSGSPATRRRRARVRSGCAFAPRCTCTSTTATTDVPPLVLVAPEHVARCIRSRGGRSQQARRKSATGRQGGARHRRGRPPC